MLKVNKKTEYALIALKHMAIKNNDELTSAREVSDIYKVPFDTTAKIMQALANKGLLNSNQGVKGGYTLKQSLKDINFVDLTEIVEKKNFDFTCEGPSGLCNLYAQCNIKSPLQSINYKVKEFFQNISLYELLQIEQDSNSSPRIPRANSNEEIKESLKS